tara:strand:- start:1471 stop:1851 length:381 start_codon:yes stop_codon:yes gene_type:complete
MNDKLIVKVNTSDNPWISKYEDFTFSRKKIEAIAKNLVAECEGRDYQSSYSYSGHVSSVIEKSWDKTCGSIIPLYKALVVILRSLQKPNEGWSGGATAAIRCLERSMAYATPGFIEAKRYNEIYGS